MLSDIYISNIWHKLHFCKRNKSCKMFFDIFHTEMTHWFQSWALNDPFILITGFIFEFSVFVMIKNHFAMFDSFAKMKLVPNVRDINDTKQIWLQADRYLHGDCMDMNCPITISMIHAVTVLRPELKKSSNLLQKSLEPFIIHSSYLTPEWINIFC